LLAVEELDVIELGPSAGLNLVWDRYRYSYAAGEWGPEDAPLRLEGEERSRVPFALLEVSPRVARRVGVDLAPIDVTTDEGARLLQCFVWAGQEERFDQLTRCNRSCARIRQTVRGNCRRVRGRCASPDLVFGRRHSHVPDETRAAVGDALAASAPLAFVGGGRAATAGLGAWNVPAGDRRFVGHADFQRLAGLRPVITSPHSEAEADQTPARLAAAA
jgi:hypothetical protein